ncbi:tRNA-dihydrouridine(47) synthase [NAD(P)(+)]-like isoform X2 [Macrosteles quadrilineatus]|uniref:tRNA-dihydrouridine(47) synthase [NAD(P)(+)]-like isoform X2 n=1 Tax=Macrosteles quadrilineatus TaxID=74068 RepID=UPI0023E2AD71|nr:tRNA-dihydrouridine(47) synthase [NAD(P)(+)]-like isoform X2 [Macrosteles quadrilineatus]
MKRVTRFPQNVSNESKNQSSEVTGSKAGEKRKQWENGYGGGRNSKRSKKQRGMNKNRGVTYKVDREQELCPRLIDRRTDTDPKCNMDTCKFTHDLQHYSSNKLPSLGDECYVFNTRGHCPRGLTCRFNSKHVTAEGLNIVNEALYAEWQANVSLHTVNGLNHSVQYALRKRTYNFDKSEKVLVELNKGIQANKQQTKDIECEPVLETKLEGTSKPADAKDDRPSECVVDKTLGPTLNNGTAKSEGSEKKKIDWKDKLILAPLTTLGNLPFRRVCKEFGADVTVSEMAMASCLLQGKPQEWALTKRHGSEDIFGVQVCGGNTNVMTRCAQLLQEQTNIDFIDINVGCPIDLVYNQGAGSGLLNKKKALFSIVKSMKSVIDVPLSVKTRIGVYSSKPVAHTMMRDLVDAGADVVMVHGRSKEQRYTKLADWEYIEQCAQAAAPTPLVGNGDILSYEDYDLVREKSPTCAAVMIGRGALIKPWIFTEIKERRHWDISSQERLQMLRRFTNYGLEHWGSDTKGVESTRKFLLEWLSFLYRYMPVGLMEKPPQKMNERVPLFEGRDELECLMASPNSTDWIKISEMLLGPVPDGFQFIPKHKANAWSAT